MDWLRDFQQSFREPVYGFLSYSWPFIAGAILIALGWYVASVTQRRRRGGANADAASDMDGDGGGDGGGGD
ncbi:hypothetical protein PRN20_17235 [Devosia sp. ZB163]|jgi:hypothetical protein|uniref:hypothetical protein n=1 Tax=Devosia sp. ZB163 TaxID=3025938 RepID=UPI0023615C78|nr:hypothetical protein [Devosia sp. ZB163]MDC9825478.1 hypothetical protein [Devosia sp. ZB163]